MVSALGGTPTRVVVAEDQPLIRRALVGLVGEHPALQLEAAARDGDEALTAIAAHLPDVALIDVRLPHRYGAAVLQAMRARGLATRVVFLTGQDQTRAWSSLLAPGASGCVSTGADEEEICAALVAAGKAHLTGRRPKRDPRAGRLSGREIQILELAASSRSSEQIAKALYLSPATVRTYMNRIYEKLGVRGRAAAVAHGIRHGLIY